MEIANVNSEKDDGAAHSGSGLGSLKAPFLAGLPHFLIGLLIGVGKLLSTSASPLSPLLSIIVGISLVCLVAGVLFFAWRQGWPLWSANWYGYGTWIVLAVTVFVIQRFNLENDWRYTNALFLAWIGICVIGYFLILLKDELKALMAVAFLFPFLGILLLEFVPNPIEGWLAIGVFLLIALTTGIITHLNDFSSGLKLLLGCYLLIGLSLAYVGEYQASDLPSLLPCNPTFSDFVELLGLNWAVAFGLVAVPILIRRLWNFAVKRFQVSQ